MKSHPVVYLARHGETVYNAAHRAQGAKVSSPMTTRGIAQAASIAAALQQHLGSPADVDIWSSPSTRTQQTAAIIAEYLAKSYFEVKMDPRLLEIGLGDWEGEYYDDIAETYGPVFDADGGFFIRQAPGGEWYPQIAERLREWLSELDPARPLVAISHSITTRVLRGILVSGAVARIAGVSIAMDAPQGTVIKIETGAETVLQFRGEEKR